MIGEFSLRRTNQIGNNNFVVNLNPKGKRDDFFVASRKYMGSYYFFCITEEGNVVCFGAEHADGGDTRRTKVHLYIVSKNAPKNISWKSVDTTQIEVIHVKRRNLKISMDTYVDRILVVCEDVNGIRRRVVLALYKKDIQKIRNRLFLPK